MAQRDMVAEPRFLDSPTNEVPNPHAGTMHHKDHEIKPRTRGGQPPEKRPVVVICEQVNRLVAEKIRDSINTVITLARVKGGTVVAGKAVEVQSDLNTLAYNVQFGNMDPDDGADMAARKVKRFSRLCR